MVFTGNIAGVNYNTPPIPHELWVKLGKALESEKVTMKLSGCDHKTTITGATTGEVEGADFPYSLNILLCRTSGCVNAKESDPELDFLRHDAMMGSFDTHWMPFDQEKNVIKVTHSSGIEHFFSWKKENDSYMLSSSLNDEVYEAKIISNFFQPLAIVTHEGTSYSLRKYIASLLKFVTPEEDKASFTESFPGQTKILWQDWHEKRSRKKDKNVYMCARCGKINHSLISSMVSLQSTRFCTCTRWENYSTH